MITGLQVAKVVGGSVADIILNEFASYCVEVTKDKELEEKVEICLGRAIQKSLTDYSDDKYEAEWDQNSFCEYLHNQSDWNADRFFSYSFEECKELILGYLDEEKQGRYPYVADEDWYKNFLSNYKKELLRDDVTFRYLMFLYFEQKDGEENKRNKEIDQFVKIIKSNLNDTRYRDFYKDSDFVNEVLFKFANSHLDLNCSDWMIEFAYALTDIFDHVPLGEKSKMLADKIITILDERAVIPQRESLQKRIGCIYTHVIAEEPDEGKEKTLDDAEIEFSKIKDMIDEWSQREKKTDGDVDFVNGLYESDLGALYLKRADVLKGRGDLEGQKIALENALVHQKAGEKLREKYLRSVSVYDEEYEDAEIRLYQSKSNVAGTYYRLGDYEDSLKSHREVLSYRLKKELKSKAYLTKGYMIGCYLGMFDNGLKKQEDIEECKCLLKDCEDYCRNEGRERRLKDILEKKERFEDIVHKGGCRVIKEGVGI